MNIIVLVPKVVNRYIASFPEVTNNAYKYFNYDNRVVEERVPRGDRRIPYLGPNDFTDVDYDALVQAAKRSINGTLARYSMDVACEDALHTVIKSFGSGQFDGKVNASRYSVLLCELKKSFGICPSPFQAAPVEIVRQADESIEARQKREEKTTKTLHPRVLRELGLKMKDIPRHRTQRVQKGIPHIVRTDKGVEVKKS